MRKNILVFALMLPLLTFGMLMMGEEKSDEYLGAKGLWISNGKAEVFLTSVPFPRITVFRFVGHESPLKSVTNYPNAGIRTWFMEPEENEFSSLPSMKPAKIERLGPFSVRMTGEPDEKSRLQLIMEVSLDENKAVLKIRHGLKNLRDEKRRLAVWPIMVFHRNGIGLVPWASCPQPKIRRYILFLKTNAVEELLKTGLDAFAFDFRCTSIGGQLKVGVVSDAGWAAFIWPGGILKSNVEFVKDAEYPEGGGTVTFYSCGQKPEEGQCEVEHIGPLTDVKSGETLWFDQKLEILPKIKMNDNIDADVLLGGISKLAK